MHPGTLSNHSSAELPGTKSCCKACEANPAPTAPGVVCHVETTMHTNTCDCLPYSYVTCTINYLKVLSFKCWASTSPLLTTQPSPSILQWVGACYSPQGEQSPPVMKTHSKAHPKQIACHTPCSTHLLKPQASGDLG